MQAISTAFFTQAWTRIFWRCWYLTMNQKVKLRVPQELISRIKMKDAFVSMFQESSYRGSDISAGRMLPHVLHKGPKVDGG